MKKKVPQAEGQQNVEVRVLEFYCGIGGAAAVFAQLPQARVVGAFDVSLLALEIYRQNFSHSTVPGLVEFIPTDKLARYEADLWWLSPPCQPFTRRGLQRDSQDPRSRTFLAILDRIAALRPRIVALENVPPFQGSKVHEMLIDTLEKAGYENRIEKCLCPTEFGFPNRRKRYYLVASRESLLDLDSPLRVARVLSDFVDTNPSSELQVAPLTLKNYHHAMHILDPKDPHALTQCFTSAYGRSPVRSGSYLAAGEGVRYFSPQEILRLLGFPSTFRLSMSISRRKAWSLVCNSLSLPVVSYMLSAIPELNSSEKTHFLRR